MSPLLQQYQQQQRPDLYFVLEAHKLVEKKSIADTTHRIPTKRLEGTQVNKLARFCNDDVRLAGLAY